MNALTSYSRTTEKGKLPLMGEDAILETLYEVGLREDSYVVIGGASLVLRGIKSLTEDIDMLVSDEAMLELSERPGALQKKPPMRARYRGATNHTIWVRDESLPLPISATDELGDGYYPMSFRETKWRAETVSFVPCIPLEDVIRSKEALQRKKDIRDLEAIARFTGGTLNLPAPLFQAPFEWS